MKRTAYIQEEVKTTVTHAEDAFWVIGVLHLNVMVYIITDGIYHKVGRSANPLKRIKSIQTSNARMICSCYVLDLPDYFEKKIHQRLRGYKTDARNEWFDIGNISLEQILRYPLIPQTCDLECSRKRAESINLELAALKRRDLSPVSSTKKEDTKKKIKFILDDIKVKLNTRKNKTGIGYDLYVKKTGFTKKEIAFFVRSAKLSKRVQNHNKEVFNQVK